MIARVSVLALAFLLLASLCVAQYTQGSYYADEDLFSDSTQASPLSLQNDESDNTLSFGEDAESLAFAPLLHRRLVNNNFVIAKPATAKPVEFVKAGVKWYVGRLSLLSLIECLRHANLLKYFKIISHYCTVDCKDSDLFSHCDTYTIQYGCHLNVRHNIS